MDSEKRAKNLVKQASTPTGGGGKQLITPEIVIPEPSGIAQTLQIPTKKKKHPKNIGKLLNQVQDDKNIKKQEEVVSEKNIQIPPKSGKCNIQSKLHIRNAAIAASMCALLTINPLSVKAEESDVTGMPTLDKLNEEGVLIPNTTDVYPNSGYTLNPVNTPIPSKTITKYIINEITKEVTPVYYEVAMRKTEYGDTTNKTNPVYFKWDKDSRNNNILVSASSSDKDITYYVKNAGSIETNIKDTGTLTNPSSPTEIIGGASVNNPDGTTITINDTVYQNNQTSGKLVSTSTSYANYSATIQGGAIYNAGTITELNADFINNSVTGETEFVKYEPDLKVNGGAIFNKNEIGNINGDFVANYASSDSEWSWSYGGAIDNNGTINNINGNFIANYVYSGIESHGGAIRNTGTINDINGAFIGNYTSSDTSHGGAIYNEGTINDINGNFINNYSKTTFGSGGGAIYNNYSGVIRNITGDFIGNYIEDDVLYLQGGAISNAGSIDYITGDFIGNYAKLSNEWGSKTQGGAVYNTGTIKGIKGNFIENYVEQGHVDGSYESYLAAGGALLNTETIDNISGAFLNNHAVTNGDNTIIYGGAIANYTEYGNNSKIGTIENSVFIGNYAKAAGESAIAMGGAIYNIGTINEIKNSSFINNYAQTDGENSSAVGGAIYSNSALNLIAENGGSSVISGNYTMINGVKDDTAIYLSTFVTDEYDDDLGETVYTNSVAKLTLNANTDGVIIINDKITGEQGGGTYYTEWNSSTWERDKIELTPDDQNWKLNITGDSTGLVQINNNVEAVTGEADIALTNVTLHLAKSDTVFNGNNFTINSGSLSMLNNQAGTMALKDFTLNGNTNFAADVNLANKTMDRITADTYTVDTAATLNVNYLNLLNDAKTAETYIPFASPELANNVEYTGINPVAYSPIYKYDVSYLKDSGEFLFSCPAITGGGGTTDNYNPAVLPTPVNNQAGGYTTQLQTFNYAFQHSDTFMQIPAAQRFAIINRNKYALSPTGDATDVGTFSPLLTKFETGGIWFKPYASFENIPLKNGPKVNNINYGTLVGFDSDLKSIKHGWERVLTGYIGYNGATQNFSGVTSNQNGGILGTTATFYKGNFFNATTLSVGATAGSNNTMYGSEDYTMLLAGIADKFGYNFEFKEGKYIIQPSMLLSYSFVNTFDYRNAAGVNIQSDPLNALQLAPGIKFIMNTKNGWQPYIGVNMVWNIMDQTKVKANDVRLPSMSIDPYVEYGLGVQRKWGERFMGYAQAMVHNGGRNGISLNGGFRWAIGKK